MKSQLQEKECPKQEQINIFSIAFNQRKRINLQKIAKYMKDRHNGLIQRRRIYTLIQETLYEKIESTRQNIKQYIRYFQQMLSWYQIIIKNIKKQQLEKKTKQICQFQIFQKAISKLQELNSIQVIQTQSMLSWIEKNVLIILKNSYQNFKDSTKILRKQVISIFNDADSARHSQSKFYSKIQDNNDLLENQIYLIDKIQSTNNFTIQWGNKLIQNWKKLLKQQTQIRESLKNNILEYNRRYCKIYHHNQTNNNIQDFWKKINKQSDIKVIFSSFLEQKQMQFITFGSISRKFQQQLQQFIKLDHDEKRYGTIIPLIQILQNKYFKCKIQKQKKQWISIKLYFSLDQHVLIFDEEKKKLMLKINSKGVQTKIISQNMIQLIGKQTGIIFDSTRKQLLHFDTSDQVQELSFYIENIMQENNPVEKKTN